MAISIDVNDRFLTIIDTTIPQVLCILLVTPYGSIHSFNWYIAISIDGKDRYLIIIDTTMPQVLRIILVTPHESIHSIDTWHDIHSYRYMTISIEGNDRYWTIIDTTVPQVLYTILVGIFQNHIKRSKYGCRWENSSFSSHFMFISTTTCLVTTTFPVPWPTKELAWGPLIHLSFSWSAVKKSF